MAELKITAEAQKFLSSLGASSLDDLSLAAEAGDITREILVEHGVLKIPALKLMKAIEQVGR